MAQEWVNAINGDAGWWQKLGCTSETAVSQEHDWKPAYRQDAQGCKEGKTWPVLKRQNLKRISSWREEDQGDGDEQMAAPRGEWHSWRGSENTAMWRQARGFHLCSADAFQWTQQVLQLLVFPRPMERSGLLLFQPTLHNWSLIQFSIG